MNQDHQPPNGAPRREGLRTARLPDDAWLTLVEQLRTLDREDFDAAVLAVRIGRRGA